MIGSPRKKLLFVCSRNRLRSLTAERLFHCIIRGEELVFRAEAPAGTQGVRITHTATGWQQEAYSEGGTYALPGF
jgi:protein-tyrosine-phosphatase